MTIGVGIVILYWLTDWPALVSTGILMLPIGLGMVLMGLAVTAIWAVQARQLAKGNERGTPWGKVALMVLLQLANFPVAYGCAWIGSDLAMAPHLMIRVVNETGAAVDNVTIYAAGTVEERRSLATGDAAHHFVRAKRVTNVDVEIQQGAKHKRFAPALDPKLRTEGGLLQVTLKPDLETELQQDVGERD